MQQVPEKKRVPGRPPQRWLGDVEKDLKTLKIINLKCQAFNGFRWKKHVGMALACLGLLKLIRREKLYRRFPVETT